MTRKSLFLLFLPASAVEGIKSVRSVCVCLSVSEHSHGRTVWPIILPLPLKWEVITSWVLVSHHYYRMSCHNWMINNLVINPFSYLIYARDIMEQSGDISISILWEQDLSNLSRGNSGPSDPIILNQFYSIQIEALYSQHSVIHSIRLGYVKMK